MAVIKPLFINLTEYSAADERLGFAGLVAQSAPGVARTGVLGSVPAVSLSGSTVQVGPFACAIGTAKGVYLTGLDSVTPASGSVAPADATNGRLDRIVLEVPADPVAPATAPAHLGRLRLVPGTAAAIPVLPALPANALHVGQVQMPKSPNGAAVTPVLTVDPPLTAAAGAPIPIRSAAERAGLPVTEGLRAQVVGSNAVDIVRNGAWFEGDTGWIKLVPVQGFESYEPDGWGGVWFRCKNDLVTITGAVTRGAAWGANQAILALDAKWRPPRQIQGIECLAKPTANGVDVILSPGSGAKSFHVSYPL